MIVIYLFKIYLFIIYIFVCFYLFIYFINLFSIELLILFIMFDDFQVRIHLIYETMNVHALYRISRRL